MAASVTGDWLAECKDCGHEWLLGVEQLPSTKCPACLRKKVVARPPERAAQILKKRTLTDRVAGKPSESRVRAAKAVEAPPVAPEPGAQPDS